MIKLIQSSQFAPDVGVGMEIVDAGGLSKSAERHQAETVFGKSYDELKPDKKHVGIHVVALGDEEHYGPNRNMDAMPADSLRKYHDTFVSHGHVFRHHRNKDPKKSIGDIVASAYNEPMGRVELFIHADRDKAAPELERLEREGEIPFSMALNEEWDECFRPGTLVLTGTGYRPIETVSVGDEVITAESGRHTVIRHICKNASRFTSIKVRGLPDNIESTSNHPYFVIRSEKIRSCHGSVKGKRRRHTLKDGNKCTCSSCGKQIDVSPEIVAAENVGADDYLCVKLDRSAQSDSVGVSFAYLCGVYAGDGNIEYASGDFINEVTGVRVSASAADNDLCIVRRIESAFNLCTGKACCIYDEKHDRAAKVLVLRDRLLAGRILKFVHGISTNKTISSDVYNWSLAEKSAFVAGLIDSDGHVLCSKVKQAVRILSTSKALALGVQRIMWDIGMPATCGYGSTVENLSRNGAFGGRNPVYHVFVSDPCDDLIRFSAKLSREWNREFISRKGGHGILIAGGYVLLPVKDVLTFDGDFVEVHNLEVDADHSYVVEGVGVHNCSRCHQRRHGANDPKQCVHIREHLGEMSEDGKRVYMINREYTFFDISFVGKPADRIAWDLMKVYPDEDSDDGKEDTEKDASATLPFDSEKLAEYYGVEAPDDVAISSEPAMRKRAYAQLLLSLNDRYVGLLTKAASADSVRDRYLVELCKVAASPVSDETVERLRALEPGDAFRLLGDAGVVMDARAFYKYAMGNEYPAVEPYISGVGACVPVVVKEAMETNNLQKLCNDRTFDAADVVEKTAENKGLVAKLRESSRIDSLDDAILDGSLRGGRTDVDTRFGNMLQNVVTKKLAAKYAAYKLAAIDAIVTSRRGIKPDKQEQTGKLAECAVALSVLQDMRRRN